MPNYRCIRWQGLTWVVNAIKMSKARRERRNSHWLVKAGLNWQRDCTALPTKIHNIVSPAVTQVTLVYGWNGVINERLRCPISKPASNNGNRTTFLARFLYLCVTLCLLSSRYTLSPPLSTSSIILHQIQFVSSSSLSNLYAELNWKSASTPPSTARLINVTWERRVNPLFIPWNSLRLSTSGAFSRKTGSL